MALPRIPRAVIFDMDGTLFDSEQLYADAFADTVARLELAVDPRFVERCIGLPRQPTLDIFEREFGHLAVTTKLFAAWDDECHSRMKSQPVPLKPGAQELLGTLSSHAIPCAIATSGKHLAVDLNFSGHRIRHHFTTIVAQGDYRLGKPHSEPFLTAADRLKVKPEDCLALEDSHNGVVSASSAGMMTVMVPDRIEPSEEHRRLCSHIAEDLHEVERLVSSLLGRREASQCRQ